MRTNCDASARAEFVKQLVHWSARIGSASARRARPVVPTRSQAAHPLGGVVLTPLHGPNMHRFTVTKEGAQNYCLAKTAFTAAADAMRDLASCIHVEIARGKTPWTQPWPTDVLKLGLRDIDAKLDECLKWRDVEDELWRLLRLPPVTPFAAQDWCDFAGVTQSEFARAVARSGAVAEPHFQISLDGWQSIAGRLWERTVPLRILAEFFGELAAVDEPIDGRRRPHATKELLEAAKKVGVSEDRVKNILLDRFPDEICSALGAKPTNVRHTLSKYFRDVVREMNGHTRPNKYRRKT